MEGKRLIPLYQPFVSASPCVVYILLISSCWVLLSFPQVHNAGFHWTCDYCHLLKGDISTSTIKTLTFTMFFFLYLKCSFSPYIMYVKVPWAGYESSLSLFRSSGLHYFHLCEPKVRSGPRGQSQHLKCHLEATEVSCSWKEDDSIVVCCHVPHQTPAQWRDASQKAGVLPQGKTCTDKSQDLWRNSLLNGDGETHVDGNGLSPSLTGSPA